MTAIAAAVLAITMVAAPALAATAPNAGADRMVNEDTLTTFTGTDASGTATSEGWIFEGNIVDGNPAQWNFTTPGSYSVSFWADDGAGSNTSDTMTVTVRDTTPPTANAGADQSVNEDSSVTFNGAGSTDNDPNFGSNARYYWLFWDGGASVSLNGATPSYTFATPGTYGVTLVVLDAAGNYGSDSSVISVADITDPTAAIAGGSPQSHNEDTAITLDASGSSDNDPTFSYTGSYTWTFVDGTAQTLTGKTASYTFATPGTYAITLNVTDASGNWAATSASFVIDDVTPPSAAWTISGGLSFAEDAAQTLDGTSSTDNVAISTYEWSIAYYGGSTTAYGATTSFTWATPGTYGVTLTAYDAAGNSDSLAGTVTVADVTSPSATIAGGSPQSYDDGATVSLDGSGSTDNDPAFSSSASYSWAIAGPVSANLTGASTSFTFDTPGTYTVTLSVADAAGNVGTASAAINIADITPPSVSIASGPASIEQFLSADHSGSATDDVGVNASGWAFTENSVALNLTGPTMSRSWDFSGSYTLTFWARDDAGNIATTTMSLSVTPDVTPPSLDITGPSTGDNKNAVTLTGTVVQELDPSCPTTCSWTWTVTDRTGATTTAATGTSTLTYTFQPGRNTVQLDVSDASGNTGSTSHSIDVNELVDADAVWSTDLVLNWDVTVSGGATLTVRGVSISEPDLVSEARFLVTDGRLIFENARLGTANGGPSGFVITASPDPAAANPAVVLYFNASTILSLRQPVSVEGGTLAATDSTFGGVLTGGTGAVHGTDASLFFTNVTIDSSGALGSYGILSTLSSGVTFGTTKEVRLDGAAIRSSADAVRLEASGVGGSTSVFMRDVDLMAGSSLGLAIDVDGGTGDYSFDLTRVGARGTPSSPIGATFHSQFANTADWSIADSTFAGSLPGMRFSFLDTAAACSFDLSNVSVRASGAGVMLDFLNEQGGAPAWVVSNACTATLDRVHLDANAGPGLSIQRTSASKEETHPNFLAFSLSAADSTFNGNGGPGIAFLADHGYIAPYDTAIDLSFSLTDVELNRNQAGFSWEGYYVRASMNVEMTRVQVDNNTEDGLHHYQFRTPEFAGIDHIGQYSFNITDSSFTANERGLYFYNDYLLGQQNFSFDIQNTVIEHQRSGAVYWYSHYLQYYRDQGDVYQSSDTHVRWNFDHVRVTNNSGENALYFYLYYCYGYSDDPGYCLYHVTLNASQVEDNDGTGVYFYARYLIYNHGNTYLNILNGTTIDRNGNYGVYTYCYECEYGRNLFGGRWPAEFHVVLRDSSVSYNDLDGLYVYMYYHYYGTTPSGLDIDRGQFVGNGGDGIYFYNRYNYYGVGIKNSILNSNISGNVGNGYETYYERQYNTCSDCVVEVVDGNHFEGNGGNDILLGYPQSYYRSGGMWFINYTNNEFVRPNVAAIQSYLTISYSGSVDYAFGERVNISGNRITNASGAPIHFELDSVGPIGNVEVIFSDNYIADSGDATVLKMPGEDGARQSWTLINNTFLRSAGTALKLEQPNSGAGNIGSITFERNRFEDTGATAFSLSQSNIRMSGSIIRDSVFINQRKALELRNVDALVDNITIRGSLQTDIELTDGQLEIHNTPVDTQKLKPVGTLATFNVYFHLKLDVLWAGSSDPALGSIVEIADALGITFYVGAIGDDQGVPDLELWSFSMTVQGVLGRSPFRVLVSFFEISQSQVIDLPSDREVTLFLHDDIEPTVVISTPLDGYSTRHSYLTIEGTAYDSQSGFQFDLGDLQTATAYVQVSSDNQTWRDVHIVDADVFKVHFNYTFTDLAEAVDHLYVRVADEAGNVVVEAVRVTVDWTAPVVTLLEQVPSVTNAGSVHVAAETEIGAQVLVNGVRPPELFIRPDGVHIYFQMDIPLVEGPNTVTVMAFDSLSNEGSASFFVLVDRKAPYLAVLSPTPDALVNSTSIVVRGQAADRNGVTVTVNGVAAPVVDGNFSAVVRLDGEVNRVEVIATDSAGNDVLVLRDVRFDDTPPWLDVQSPRQFALLGAGEVDVVGIVEPGSRLIIDDEAVDTPTGSFSRRILLHEGENEIRLVAIDGAGNVMVQVQRVTVDTAKPVIHIEAPLNQSVQNRATVLFSGSVADDHSFTITVGGASVLPDADGSFTVPVALFEGTNIVRVEAVDGAGNMAELDVVVQRDSTAPYFSPSIDGVFTEGGQTKTHGDFVVIQGLAERNVLVEACSEGPSGESLCEALPVSPSGEFRSYQHLEPNRENQITVRATDTAGNVASRTFLVQQEPEQVVAPAATPAAAYIMYVTAAAVLGAGIYLLMFSRRGKGGGGDPLTDMEPTGTPTDSGVDAAGGATGGADPAGAPYEPGWPDPQGPGAPAPDGEPMEPGQTPPPGGSGAPYDSTDVQKEGSQ